MGLLSELQLCWFGASFKAVARSTVGSAVGMLVTRGSGECGLCLVLGGWDWLQYFCSVGWSWAMVPFQGVQLGPQSVSLFLSLWTGVTPTGTPTSTPHFYTLLCIWWKLLPLKAISRAHKYSHIWVICHVSAFNQIKRIMSLGYIFIY